MIGFLTLQVISVTDSLLYKLSVSQIPYFTSYQYHRFLT